MRGPQGGRPMAPEGPKGWRKNGAEEWRGEIAKNG